LLANLNSNNSGAYYIKTGSIRFKPLKDSFLIW
jgi:hypothetical protein